MKKCDLGDLGAPRRSKALKTQLCDSDPSEHQKTSYTYAKTQKCLFVTFLFFGKVENCSLFSRAIREGKLPTEERTFSSKTLQVAKVAPMALFSLQDDPSAPTLMFSEVKSMVLGLQNAFGRSKRVLEQLLHFGTQRSCAWQGLYRGESGPFKIGELLAPKCTLGALGAHWVPLGPRLAGWLLRAQS